jgi:SAM-dependent methyltransferase
MYKRIAEYFKEPMEGKILGISGIDNFRPLISSNASVVDTSFPDVDMQELPYEDSTFDFVISDQVIEHVEEPKKAIIESHRVLKYEGTAIHTTCFLNGIHTYPRDYWRFSTDALEHLCEDFSKIIQSEGWGNRIAILLCFLGNRFRSLRIPDKGNNPLRMIATWNEKLYPIVTWIIAKK